MCSQYRNELKYLINKAQQKTISNRLELICDIDKYSDDDGYMVSSIYFDDYIDSCVIDKLSGVIKRKKFRIRVYNNNDNSIKLERKTKNANACKKDSSIITKEEYDKIITGDFNFLKGSKDNVRNDFYILSRTRLLKPKIVVEYIRKAYVFKYGDVRITFDDRLRGSITKHDLFSNNNIFMDIITKDQTILEVKYTGFLPEIVKNTIQHAQGNMQAISKYSNCRTAI